jgi:hypothetical protein
MSGISIEKEFNGVMNTDIVVACSVVHYFMLTGKATLQCVVNRYSSAPTHPPMQDDREHLGKIQNTRPETNQRECDNDTIIIAGRGAGREGGISP